MKRETWVVFLLLIMLTITTACGRFETFTPTAGEDEQESAVAPSATAQESTGTPSSTQPEYMKLAESGVSTNAEWTPVIQDFNGVEMVLVPAGCFIMGSSEEEINVAYENCKNSSATCETAYALDWFASEAPRHQICFSKPFWIDRYEVTNAQFRLFSGQADEKSRWTGDNRPREMINWYEADAYCELRGVRLPTEAEWEYAARGPDSLTYPWGNGFVADNVVYEGNANGQTAEVGSRLGDASWVGALDMSGNVAEWTSSLIKYYPYDVFDGREKRKIAFPRVVRAGSWTNWDANGSETSFGAEVTAFLRAAYRSGIDQEARGSSLGFRCASSITGSSVSKTTYQYLEKSSDYAPLPGGDWSVSTPEGQGLDPALVIDLYGRAAKLKTIFGLLIIKNGYLVAERYFRGASFSKPELASVTKSFTSALVGLAQKQGCLANVDQKMLDFFPEYTSQITDARKAEITIEDMLQMRSGYPWEEFTPPYLDTLFSNTNWLPRIVDFPLTSDPGTVFAYSNLTAYLLGVIVARACGTDLRTFAEQNLFQPLGIEVSNWWYLAEDGYYSGEEGLYLTARDAAKLGLLYLNHGVYAGRQVVPADWVNSSLQRYSQGIYANRLGDYFHQIGYGYLWWSASAGDHQFFYAWGHGGNLIVLLEDFDMVIVTTADSLSGVGSEEAWQREKAIIDLVGRFIQSLPAQ
jgi:formylglycine-generating enzyme required for sulfatase activity/CubicO group peptidase (beta-lactamase class C family)